MKFAQDFLGCLLKNNVVFKNRCNVHVFITRRDKLMASFARSGKKDGEKNNADRFGLKPGAEYHGYVLIERLGAGGFGEAWLAENLDGEKLALKFRLISTLRP
jgi:hypothetical protein